MTVAPPWLVPVSMTAHELHLVAADSTRVGNTRFCLVIDGIQHSSDGTLSSEEQRGLVRYDPPLQLTKGQLVGVALDGSTDFNGTPCLIVDTPVPWSVSGPGNGTPGASALTQAQDAEAYTPAVSADWPDPDPDDKSEALDLLAERTTDVEDALNEMPSNDAEYLVLNNHASLDADRQLVAGTGLTGTDAGAGSTYTLNVDSEIWGTKFTEASVSGGGAFMLGDPGFPAGLVDAQKMFVSDGTGATAVIPLNATHAWPIGQAFRFLVGTGSLIIDIEDPSIDIYLNGALTATEPYTVGSWAFLYKHNIDEWIIIGDVS